MNSFQELNLSPALNRALAEMGFEKPSPIQEQALPILLDRKTRDFIGLAATGTGKTAAFTIPMLERLDPGSRAIQTLILCPTRELAQQVAGQITLLGKYLSTKALAIYGGASFGDQISGLRRGASVVVGTPGRVVDHLNRGTLKLDQVQTLILDEADEMISMGFKDDLEFILKAIRGEEEAESDDSDAAIEGELNIADTRVKTWLFSATMSPEVRRVADTYLYKPKQVQVNRQEMVPSAVEQRYFITQESNKPEVLCKLIDAAPEFYGIVFCQTKALVADLTDYLKGRGYPVDCLHGDMDQNARERVMRAYRERRITILVATDVACRGLDVKDISHVVNYSLPRELDNYVHRIGRTGRVGKTGLAFNLVTGSHRGLIGRIEKMTKTRMLEGRIPSRKEIGAKKVAAHLTQFADLTAPGRAIELLGPEWKTALEGMTKEEIAGRFLLLMNPEIFGETPKAEARSSGPSPIIANVRPMHVAPMNLSMSGPITSPAPIITPVTGGAVVIKTASSDDLKQDRFVPSARPERSRERIGGGERTADRFYGAPRFDSGRDRPFPGRSAGADRFRGPGSAPSPFASRGRKPAWSPNGGRSGNAFGGGSSFGGGKSYGGNSGGGGFGGGGSFGNKKPWGEKRETIGKPRGNYNRGFGRKAD